MNSSLFQNMLARYPIATKDDLGSVLSRRDSTLLTVGFSLRTDNEQCYNQVPQGRHL
jgi:hypothetical protein